MKKKLMKKLVKQNDKIIDLLARIKSNQDRNLEKVIKKIERNSKNKSSKRRYSKHRMPYTDYPYQNDEVSD